MKTKYILITILLLVITGCHWAEWFERPDEPYRRLYVPDSLRFPYETGDTMIFRCVTNNTVIYDTFELEKSSQMYQGAYERVYLKYKNAKKLFSLQETYKIAYGHMTVFYKVDTNSCQIMSYNSFYEEIELNNIVYKNVKFSEYYKEYITVYVNTENGLIRYITPENYIFDIFKYIQ